MIVLKRIFLLLLGFSLFSCCSTVKKVADVNTDAIFDMPNVIVYKTTKDYSNNVPVIMDAERTRIVRYPAPVDVRRGNSYANPIQLKNGYWLDCFGINQNVVFLDYTFEQYANLSEVPTIEALMSHIVDNYPLDEMWNCGKSTKYKSIEDIVDIVKNNFNNCQKLYFK